MIIVMYTQVVLIGISLAAANTSTGIFLIHILELIIANLLFRFFNCLLYLHISGICTFKPISGTECPDNADLNECTKDMNHNELCEADATLPDGNSNTQVNNCGQFDVFKCLKGTH